MHTVRSKSRYGPLNIMLQIDYGSDFKTICILWLNEYNSPTEVQRKFRAMCGKHEPPPSQNMIMKWHQTLLDTEFFEPRLLEHRLRAPDPSNANRVAVIDHYVKIQTRGAACLDISVYTD